MNKLKNWKYLGAFLGAFGGIQFIVITIIAQIIYPGGYSITENYFSELGWTVSVVNGQPTPITLILFITTCTIATICVIPFVLSMRTVFLKKKSTKYISTVGTIFELVAAPCLSLLAYFPPNLYMDQHMLATRIFFVLTGLTIIVYSIAILLNDLYEKIYGYFGLAVGFYMIIHFLFLLYSAVSQKFTVYTAILWIVIQGIRLWKALDKK